MATVRPSRRGWQAIIRRKGHPTISKVFPKKALAVAWANNTESDLFKDRYLGGRTAKTTLSTILDKYEREITPRKRSAQKERSRLRILDNAMGALTVLQLTPDRVIQFVDDRLKTVCSDTVRKEINTLSVIIDASIALWGMELPANPVITAKGVLKVTKTLKPGTKRSRRITDDELIALVKAVPTSMAKLILFAVETAMRRGELAHQQWIHGRGELLLIPQTKTDRQRIIPLSKRAMAILESLPVRPDGFVWGMRPDSISHSFMLSCKKAGIKGLRFHDLRREATSRFFEKGLTIPEVAIITGHQTWNVLKQYTNLRPEDVLKKINHN